MKKSVTLIMVCLMLATVFSLIQVVQVSAISVQRTDQTITMNETVTIPPGYLWYDDNIASVASTTGFYGSFTVISGTVDFKIQSTVSGSIAILYFSILDVTYGDYRGLNWKWKATPSMGSLPCYFVFMNTGSSSAMVTYSIYIDRTAPTVPSSGYIGGTNIPNGATIGGNSYSFAVECHDPFFPSYSSDCLQVRIDDVIAQVFKDAGTIDQYNWLTIHCNLDTTRFSDGEHSISIILTDDVGNSATYSGTIFIDNNPFSNPVTWILLIAVIAVIVVVAVMVMTKRKKPEPEVGERKSAKQKPSLIQCPNCGANNPLDATFCESCGTRIVIERGEKRSE